MFESTLIETMPFQSACLKDLPNRYPVLSIEVATYGRLLIAGGSVRLVRVWKE